MLNEYIVTPDVFDPVAYQHPDAADVSLRWLKAALLEDCLVRDLRDGGWSAHCAHNAAELHRWTKEVLAKLRTNNRLRPFAPALPADPATSADWLTEGLATTGVEPVAGIIAAHATAAQTTDQRVGSVERLPAMNWWQARSPSRTMARSTVSYLGALEPILRQARSLMFIDPYLNPSSPNYGQIANLLHPLRHRQDPPIVELHRSFSLIDAGTRTFPCEAAWRQKFDPLNQTLRGAGLKAQVFLWEDFHDRFLIADVIGLSVSAGFDTPANPNDNATWTRLGRDGKEAKQREFDPATRPAALKFRFAIGAT